MTQAMRAGRKARWGLQGILLAGAMSLPLGACGLFESSPEPQTVQAEDTSQQPYPNLASVPDKPPPVSPEEIRRRVAEGLAADRTNAQHGGALTPEGTAQPAASPPGPAVAPPLPTPSTPPPAGVPEPPPPAAEPPPAPGGSAPKPTTPAPQPTAPAPTTPAPGPATAETAPANVQMVAIIFFGHEAARTDARDAAVLAEVAKLHRQYGGAIRVVGYASAQTSAAGPAEQAGNADIAAKRAAAVAALLKAQGVAEAALITEARVASGPPPQSQMPSGAAGERRVEVYLEY